MARTILSNAFSLNMLNVLMPAAGYSHSINVKTLYMDEVKDILEDGFESSIGHADIAAILSEMLEIEVTPNRRNDNLLPGDVLIVAQYIGPRLAEGATSLPEGAEIRFFRVRVR